MQINTVEYLYCSQVWMSNVLQNQQHIKTLEASVGILPTNHRQSTYGLPIVGRDIQDVGWRSVGDEDVHIHRNLRPFLSQTTHDGFTRTCPETVLYQQNSTKMASYNNLKSPQRKIMIQTFIFYLFSRSFPGCTHSKSQFQLSFKAKTCSTIHHHNPIRKFPVWRLL